MRDFFNILLNVLLATFSEYKILFLYFIYLENIYTYGNKFENVSLFNCLSSYCVCVCRNCLPFSYRNISLFFYMYLTLIWMISFWLQILLKLLDIFIIIIVVVIISWIRTSYTINVKFLKIKVNFVNPYTDCYYLGREWGLYRKK